ncbi:MAG: hypothetical protein ACOC2W_03540, partial [bacterium]
DTRISIGNECYDTLMDSGSPIGTCINCGNGICEKFENVCNCPNDCFNGQNSDYNSVEDFCNIHVGFDTSIEWMCLNEDSDLEICQLCDWN